MIKNIYINKIKGAKNTFQLLEKSEQYNKLVCFKEIRSLHDVGNTKL